MTTYKSALNLDRIWLFFAFLKDGVIAVGTSHFFEELYAGEERAFVVDLDVAFFNKCSDLLPSKYRFYVLVAPAVLCNKAFPNFA